MNQYTLPDLPYDYGALEPWIDGHIIELHHDKHHRAYVNGANSTLDKLNDARAKSDFTQIAALERELAFHVSGHVLHSLYWENMMPQGGGEPDKELLDEIVRHFRGFDAFKKQLIHTAATTMGSGWAALLYDPHAQRLLIAQIHDHQSDTVLGGVPLLVLDAWEHAYYLQYETDKGGYFEAIFNLWNWRDVLARYQHARRLDVDATTATEKGEARPQP